MPRIGRRGNGTENKTLAALAADTGLVDLGAELRASNIQQVLDELLQAEHLLQQALVDPRPVVRSTRSALDFQLGTHSGQRAP